jgi:O-methyltransferase
MRQIPRLTAKVRQSATQSKRKAYIAPSLNRARGLTMAGIPSLFSLGGQVIQLLDEGIPGDLVECGAWRGGASFLMADLLRRRGVTNRRVWLFDSFEGLPEPTDLDGAKAFEYAKDTESPTYFDNCSANVEEVKMNSSRLGLDQFTQVVKGWFHDTLPKYRDEIGMIALLRLDSDWYESVRETLENLYDQVAPGGFVVIDDYYDWDGCALAVHEFLTDRKLTHRLFSVTNSTGGGESAFFRK